jgi:hypothetical protein
MTKAADKKKSAPEAQIMVRFKAFNKDINEIWEQYSFIDFYLDKIHSLIKSDQVDHLDLVLLTRPPYRRIINSKNCYGIISRIRRKTNGRRAFVDAVALFEGYISFLSYRVYSDFPNRLSMGQSSDEDRVRRERLLDVILNSNDRDEMLEKIIEERVRGIFYGSPVDLFVNDKAKLEFRDHFKNHHVDTLKKFGEIVARRNVIVHNHSRIDRKYLREVPGTSLTGGQIVQIDDQYLRDALYVLKELAAAAAERVISSIYKATIRGGRLAQVRAAVSRNAATPTDILPPKSEIPIGSYRRRRLEVSTPRH